MLNFFRRLASPKSNVAAPVVSRLVAPSVSLRLGVKKYVAQSVVELAPEVLPEFVTPTVAPTGAYRIEVVGEAFNQPALHSIAAVSTEFDGVEWEGIAQLVAEPDNPFHPNPIKVVIQAMTVGHLPPNLARRLRGRIRTSAHLVTVRAKLTGGFRHDDGTRASIGVLLDFDPNAFAIRPVASDELNGTSSPPTGRTHPEAEDEESIAPEEE